MNMAEKYRTILNEAQAEIVEKKSRFISYAKPVKTEEEAREFIDMIKKMNWDATHNVFAYQVGERNEIQRFSDDGEPQGTAGMPVLTVLTGEEIKNTVIVVTRYFGGTLLGTGSTCIGTNDGILKLDGIKNHALAIFICIRLTRGI